MSQITRFSSSIPTHISEGCCRDSNAEFNRFFTIALGSASETEDLIILAKDLSYLEKNLAISLVEKVNFIKKNIPIKTKLKTAKSIQHSA